MKHTEEVELRKRGWKFVMTGPEDWEWVKFNNFGAAVARQGDATFQQDRRRARQAAGTED